MNPARRNNIKLILRSKEENYENRGGILAFVKVARASEIPLGKMKMVKLEGKEILIANVEGKYYALGNICTHRGGKLSEGTLQGTVVTCPRHGAKFDVATGKVISGPKILFRRLGTDPEPTFKVKVEGGDISLKLE